MITARLRWLSCCFTVLASVQAHALPKETALPTCNCYYGKDCGGEKTCKITNPWCLPGPKSCACDLKSDGLCKPKDDAGFLPPSLILDESNVTAISLGIDFYFQAYMEPIATNPDGSGAPDPNLLAAADTALLGAGSLPNSGIHQIVAEALDALIGFDFMFPHFPSTAAVLQGQARTVGVRGHIRGTPRESLELLECGRRAILGGIETRNLNVVDEELDRFWLAHPDYHPSHTGRLFNHGHADYDEKVGSPQDGQVAKLRDLVQILLHGGAPVCGDGVVEGEEECDGDPATCQQSAGCDAECRCGIVVP